MDLPHTMALPQGESAGCYCRECLTMEQAIVNLPGATVAYLRHVGPYGPAIGELWMKLRDWAIPRGLWKDSMVCYGISHDSPMDTPPEKMRYDACIEVPPSMEVDGGANRAELPGGLYARLAFHGKPEAIRAGYDRVFHQIIPQANKQFDFTRPVFELYRGIMKMDAHGSFGCDLCVPAN